jgi:sulfite reductase alpha subunit-like flavoprotein
LSLYVHILFLDANKESSFFFSLNLQAIEYEVGDVLEVLPSQNLAAVDAFIERCNLDPDAFITVSSSLVYWLNLGDSSFAWSMHTS